MASMEENQVSLHCYCGTSDTKPDMIRCQKCLRYFHTDCLKTGSPSTLAGDIFYHLTCTDCSEDGEEECDRMELQWLQVVMLALYNLQRTSAGKRGFFRWKEHICAYIDSHWFTFFGPSRKKTTTWFGTVAGILSSNRPTYFKSGVNDLGESGWWSLAEAKPPSMDTFRYQKHLAKNEKREVHHVEGLRRRRSKTTMEAAMELKAKRSLMLDAKDIRRGKRTRRSVEKFDVKTEGATTDAARSKDVTSGGGASRRDVTSPAGVTLSRDASFSVDAEERCVSADPSEASGMETESSLDDSHRISELSGDSSFINSSILSKSSLLESDLVDQDSQMSVASSNSVLWLTERDLVVGDQVPQCLMMEDDGEDNSDLDIDICAITPPASPRSQSDGLPRMAELLSSLRAGTPSIDRIKEEPLDEDSDAMPDVPNNVINDVIKREEDSSSDVEQSEASERPPDQAIQFEEADVAQTEDTTGCEEPATRSSSPETADCHPEPEPEPEPEKAESEPNPAPTRCVALSLYEERRLLKTLQGLESVVRDNPQANRLRRKLLLRQLKRERGMPLYDVDTDVRRLMTGSEATNLTSQLSRYHLNQFGLPATSSKEGDVRVLDRFQLPQIPAAYQTQPVSFLNRLVGTDDDQLHSIRSPYTARMLKPFIRRDYESRPRKLLLLEEIRAYPHRNDPTWKPFAPASIDYCYVRPQHVPTINAICREFFWPGIDLSECLQYPDFSCVVLYRKFIIGFAFMVPDVKYNEAYISFIFTHPEWRGAGIASFMLYHLIQTCMGKDVTLHVSASNSAMLMYQRFGFKPEQFILDFYDKYYPEDSIESRHAFFLRLRR